MAGLRVEAFFRRVRGGHSAVRTRIWRERREVRAYTAQFEVWTGDAWKPAVRYDSAHGHPHRDTLDGEGQVIDKFWLDPTLTNAEALTSAELEIAANAEAYREDFMRRKP